MNSATEKVHLSKHITPPFPPLYKGEGCYVVDVNGKRFLDLASQTQNTILGQCHPKINEAIITQAKKLTHASSLFFDTTIIQLAAKLSALSPIQPNRVLLKQSDGSTAIEGLLKMVRKKTEKLFIVTLEEGYHGQTGETQRASLKHISERQYLGGSPYFISIPPPVPIHDEQDNTLMVERSLFAFERALKTKKIAAILVEPIMVNAGVWALPKEWISEIEQLCTSHGVYLLFDEIQTGMGWVGRWFAAELLNSIPDGIAVGKGLAAGLPLAAVLHSEELDVLDYGEHSFAHGANPICCAAALACISEIEDKKLLKNATIMGKYLKKMLFGLAKRHSIIKDVRGAGLIIGVEFTRKTQYSSEDITKKIFEGCLKRGLLLSLCRRGKRNVLLFKPPISIRKKEIDEGIDIIDTVCSNLISDLLG